ncbi:MAG: ribosomal L7Ae/L30e/S12e/Gadd45 family protein [Candidatus Cloacimonetes bacterium]|nr:ribosomal L7Ae/L30e/S12e/Gadd45 family protein [Candidatus Cloacimonadota bacterium]
MSLLSLARRAGVVEPGLDAALRACRRGVARLLVVTEDLGKSARSKTEQMGSECKLDVIQLDTSMAELGRALGLRDVGVVAVCDANFAKGIIKKL